MGCRQYRSQRLRRSMVALQIFNRQAQARLSECLSGWIEADVGSEEVVRAMPRHKACNESRRVAPKWPSAGSVIAQELSLCRQAQHASIMVGRQYGTRVIIACLSAFTRTKQSEMGTEYS